jgi:16S rRNA (cytosine1402-N4)-methyltransferase
VPQSSDPIADPSPNFCTDFTAEPAQDFVPIEHISVLPDEAIAGLVDLETHPGGHYLDCTAGAGGHTRRILEADPEAQVTAIDRDEQALETARRKLVNFGDRVHFWHGNFADFPYVKHTGEFAGIFADLGVSSGQLDLVDRGFSFRNDAPLDMRMDRSQSFCAADIVNHWNETDLANAIYEYGEERLSRRIAREIVAKRPFASTIQLADAIARSVPKSYRYGRIHPATRTFQALRIVVNAELDSLETWLDTAPIALKPSGRIGAISFHSLEDRIVKHRFRESEQLKVLTKKPIIASDAEADANPRARSAKLRFAQRYPVTH